MSASDNDLMIIFFLEIFLFNFFYLKKKMNKKDCEIKI